MIVCKMKEGWEEGRCDIREGYDREEKKDDGIIIRGEYEEGREEGRE